MNIHFSRIICGTDLSDFSKPAVYYGIALAKAFGARLYVCHVIDFVPSTISIYGEVFLDPVIQRKRAMDYAHAQIEELVGKRYDNWEPLILFGRAADEICRMVEEKKADMVILATHARSGLKGFLLGSVAESLIRTLFCPLVILRGSTPERFMSENQVYPFRRILVGCDFSADSGLALQYALCLAQKFQAELHLVHVMPTPVDKELWHASSLETKSKFHQDLCKEYDKRLAGMVPREVSKVCIPKTCLLTGQAYEKLNNYAVSHKIDLIVLGTRGIGLVETLFLGSTTDRLVRRAPCPVLSVCHKVKERQ